MARIPLIQEQDHPELAEVIEKWTGVAAGTTSWLMVAIPCSG